MAKSDYKTQASPCIWRIDGRNLLQKYELVKQSEGTSYHNISTVMQLDLIAPNIYFLIFRYFFYSIRAGRLITKACISLSTQNSSIDYQYFIFSKL